MFNRGNMVRDFTYVDDVVEYISTVIKIATPNETFDKSNPLIQAAGLRTEYSMLETHRLFICLNI